MHYLVNAWSQTYRVTAGSEAELRQIALEMSARFYSVVSYYVVRDGKAEKLGAVWVRKGETMTPKGATPRTGTRKQLALFG